jgi:heat shock protein HtpX
MARRPELFPADRGLQARMVLAAVVTPATVLTVVAAVVLFAPRRIVVVVAIAAIVGVALAVRARREADRGHALDVGQAPDLHALVERLCTTADLPKPLLMLDEERQPNSWVVAAPGRRAELHVTRGLLDVLAAAELEAVIAHELAHLAHRDATVMTVVGGPGAVLLEGGAPLLRHGFSFWLMPGAVVALAIGWVAQLGTNALSRYRELAADSAAATITGHPAALASALTKVSGGIDRIPARDLRAVAGRDAFHLLPVADADPPWWRRGGGPTHPSLERRVARLEAMERRMHAARPSVRLD